VSKVIPKAIIGGAPFTFLWFCTKQDKPGVNLPHFPVLLDSHILRLIAIVFHRIDERLAGETTVCRIMKRGPVFLKAMGEALD
jgi:hypothetical protein